MNSFRIFETNTFLERLNQDFSGQKGRIEEKLKIRIYPQLKEQPYYGPNIKKLRNFRPDTWRYRLGDYRLFYTIDDKKKIIFMLDVVHRGEAY